MSAIITDQIRILNAKSFVNSLKSGENKLYTFVGLPNQTEYDVNWDSSPLPPKDSFDDENDCWENMISLKRINPDSDVRHVIKKNVWSSGSTYDMYRHDISRNNLSNPSEKPNLYQSNFYILNTDYKVYICLFNGASSDNNFEGVPSLIEPNFTDLEPKVTEDGYIWKYLYTLNIDDVIKFDSLNYIPVPSDWETSTKYQLIRNNAIESGQIKVVVIRNFGQTLGGPNIYTNIPILGDGSGGRVSIVVGNDERVSSVVVTNGGSNYTYGTVDVSGIAFPTGASLPKFDVIIPPKNGHGYDIYRELGAYNLLIYSRFENDQTNPDFITGNQISRIGIVNNPLDYNSNIVLDKDRASATYALKLIGKNVIDDYKGLVIEPDSIITQTVGTGITAVGKVISYDNKTGVLKYWQDRSLYGFNLGGEYDSNGNRKPENISTYGNEKIQFTSSILAGGSLDITGFPLTLKIDNGYTGITTVINNVNYNLGQRFTSGVSFPEVKPNSGDIIYVDHRPGITRSSNQKEDVKVILQF
jgi:hypothetical protein